MYKVLIGICKKCIIIFLKLTTRSLLSENIYHTILFKKVTMISNNSLELVTSLSLSISPP